MDLNTMSKDELENLQIAKEEEYRLAMQSLSMVEIQDIELSKKIIQLQLDRKNLATAISQGKHNIKRIASELRTIKPMIYRRLRGE